MTNPTTPDFRKSCAELVEKLDELTCNYDAPNQSALIERVLDELATPPPEPPTNDEIADVWLTVASEDRTLSSFGRAVLERWGK